MMEIKEAGSAVLAQDLCSVYDCERCLGWVTSADGTHVGCTHECHREDADA